LRAHDRHLAEATRRSLRDDAVLRVGALAAGAAHELATPLTTVTVAADQILRHAADPGIRRDAQTIAVQAALCRDTVGQLVAAGGHARAVGPVRERFDALIERIAERSRMTHPGLAIESGWRGALPPPDVFLDEALRQALLSLVDNAADASPHDVSIFAQRVGESLRISVADRGPGIAAQDIARIGKEFYTTKRPGQGAGLGTVLALRAIEQIGGNLRWENRNGGGLIAEIDLPLALIAAENPA